MRIVLDTNVWLDVLVFRDAGVAPIERGGFGLYADARCAEELARVLLYPACAKRLGDAGRRRAMEEFRRRATLIEAGAARSLPRCSDPDDQKFLEVALASGALFLVTKDQALLALDRRRLPFRIVTPAGFVKACNSAL